MARAKGLAIWCIRNMSGVLRVFAPATTKKSPNPKEPPITKASSTKTVKVRTVCECHSRNMEGRRQRRGSKKPSNKWIWQLGIIWLVRLIRRCWFSRIVSPPHKSTKTNLSVAPKCKCKISSNHNSRCQISSIARFLRGIMRWIINNKKCSTLRKMPRIKCWFIIKISKLWLDIIKAKPQPACSPPTPIHQT